MLVTLLNFLELYVACIFRGPCWLSVHLRHYRENFAHMEINMASGFIVLHLAHMIFKLCCDRSPRFLGVSRKTICEKQGKFGHILTCADISRSKVKRIVCRSTRTDLILLYMYVLIILSYEIINQ